MNWDSFYQAYLSFDLSLSQLRVITKAASSILQDFPDRLPQSWQAKLADSRKALALSVQKAIDSGSENDRIDKNQVIEQVPDLFKEDAPGLLNAILDVYVTASLLGKPQTELEFVEHIIAQQLVMTFAYLDAFLSDTVRTICRVRPVVLKSSKKIEWKTVVELGNWDDLINRLTEEFVYEFGWQGVISRINRMQELFGIKIKLPRQMLLGLESAELIRNLFVHNGGVVSQEFVNKTQALPAIELDGKQFSGQEWVWFIYGPLDINTTEKKMYVGAKLQIPEQALDGVAHYARVLGGELFLAVSEELFGRERGQITGVERLTQQME